MLRSEDWEHKNLPTRLRPNHYTFVLLPVYFKLLKEKGPVYFRLLKEKGVCWWRPPKGVKYRDG